MRFINTLLFSVSTGLFFTLDVYGNSWLLTQTTIINNETSLSQINANQAKQSVNSINLGNNAINTNQNFNSSGNNLNLSQDTVRFSHQAVNYIAAADITEARQTVNNVDSILLTQNNTTNNSVQTLNIAVATETGTHKKIDKLTQTVTANSVTFSGTGSNNIQAGNYIKADSISSTAGDVVQNFNVTGNVTYNLSGTNNLQAGNILIKNFNFSVNGNLSQNFSAGNVNAIFSETDTNGSVKAANYFAEKL